MQNINRKVKEGREGREESSGGGSGSGSGSGSKRSKLKLGAGLGGLRGFVQ